MKKKHQQKLIILGIGLLLIFNFPFLQSYNNHESILGFPVFYFFIFLFWTLSVVISYIILKKYFD